LLKEKLFSIDLVDVFLRNQQGKEEKGGSKNKISGFGIHMLVEVFKSNHHQVNRKSQMLI